jgi:ATP-dependent RNA helicase HrpB
MTAELPIVEVLPALKAALREQRNVVLQAPPGAGKSTGVPLALLDEPWIRGKRLVMLEPRRLATRAVSARMAQTRGEAVGRTVGYRMRLDSKVSSATRVEVVTEGVLTALLQDDPALEGIACVIFDEFHERSLQADLGLALTLDVQANLNEELRVLIMSATLAAEPVAQLIGAPVVRASGRSYPVETRHVIPATAQRSRGAGSDIETLTRRTTAAVLRALREEQGDTLVFLPGAAEIRRVESDVRAADLDRATAVLPLMGELSQEDQDRAIRPSLPGERKVVLATNIAETGLTIEGVRVVIDSGFARRPRFDPASGMSRLETLRISRASADQRRGRAGRVAPGVCYRLWSEGTDQALEAYTPAEILEADLAPLALELAGWNVTTPDALKWLDPPPAAAYAQARDLLRALGALDAAGRLTAHGRDMLKLRSHPRLAHMLLRSRALHLGELACELAALLGERDLLRRQDAARDADMRTRIEILHGESASGPAIDRAALERARRMASQLRRQLSEVRGKRASHIEPPDQVGVLLALAYPDRIARSRERGSGRYVLSNGRGARFAEAQSLARSEFLAVVELDAAEREARIFLAAPLSREGLEEAFANDIESRARVSWDARERAVRALEERLLGALVIDERVMTKPDAAQAAQAMLTGIRELGLDFLPWERDTRTFQARVRFVAALPREQGKWPDLSDAALLAAADEWLMPRLEGMTRIQHLSRLDLRAALESRLDFAQRRRLEKLAPTHLAVPSGSRIRIDYLDTDAPSLSAKVQELFGMAATPSIGSGAATVLVKILSPAGRPVQVTRDLASFWRGGYAQVRKELKGRYPRHDWPEDPLNAQASRGVRRRSR